MYVPLLHEIFISANKKLRISYLRDSIYKIATEDDCEDQICIPYEKSAFLDQIYKK